jgi:CheY-like chemotaxis protein
MPFILISTDPTRRREIAALLRPTGQEVIEVADRASVADRVREQDGVLVVDLDAPGLFAPLLEDLRQPSGSRACFQAASPNQKTAIAMSPGVHSADSTKSATSE